MAITLRDLLNERRTCEVVLRDDSGYGDGDQPELVTALEVTYRPSGYTPIVEDEFKGAIESDRSGNAFANLLDGLLIGWDLVDDDGDEIEPTLEFLRTLPNGMLVKISNAIIEDMGSGKNTRKNSGAPSQRGARQGKSLSGTR